MQPFPGGFGRNVLRPLALALLTAGGILAGPAAAMNTNGKCVNNLTAPLSPGNSCTANDVTLVLVGAGAQNDGCINTSDTVNLFLGAKLENTTGQTRYDIGIFIYNYLGADAAPSAYAGQQCAVETLKQPYSTVGTSTCGPLNLSGGSGPFYNADGNGCADLVKGQCSSAPVLMNFTTPVTIKCSDNINASGGSLPDGFADISTCTTWGNSSGQVGPGGSCSSELDVMPGTGSKCRCETVNSTVPVPRLANSCSCSPTPVRPGQSAACTVSFTNTVPNCSAVAASASSPERAQCGTASYVRYKVGYNPAQGQMLSSPAETTGGTATVDAAGNQVVWVPRNTTLSGTSLGVIGPGESGSMTYQFYVAPSVPNGTTINQTVTTYWSADGPAVSWTGEQGQAATVNCSFSVSNQATFARVSSFTAREEDGQVALAWETAAEIGTVAFEVERQDPETGRFVAVTDKPVPAVAQLPGGRYRLADPAAPLGQALTYRIIEVDQQGMREVFGPFTIQAVEIDQGTESPRSHFQADGKAASPRVLRSAREAHPRAVVASANSGNGHSTARRARIEVAQAGMQRVRAADIAGALGLSREEAAAQLRAGRFRLSRGGQDVAWQAASDGDGLVFHGEALHTAFTDVNAYWLEIGRGLTIATVAARPAGGPGAVSFLDTLHFNTDVIPAIAAPVPVEDHWIWKSFYPGFPGFDRGTFPADVPAPAAGGATLAVHLYGFAAAQRAELWVNGRRLDDLEWSGSGPATVTVPVPAGVLLDGANRVEIVALEAERGFWLDAFDLTYPRLYRAQADRLAFRVAAGGAVALTGFRGADIGVYDLSQPLAPRRLSGLASQPQADGSWGVAFTAPSAGPFVAATAGALAGTTVRRSEPADLMSRGAEYIVIAPAALRAGAERLADLRAADGLTTLVADLADITDLFGEGVSDPAAIQRFLSHAVKSWPTPPRYVVLAGKGTYDARNLLGLSSNRVPPFLVPTETGLVPADAAFADPQGRGVPSVAIGRIPALTAAELNAYVDKLAAYESDPGGPWAGRMLLLADDADLAGDFPAVSAALAGALPAGLALTRIDADPAQTPLRRSEIQSALREGQALMSYVGHGGLDRLGTEGLLLTSDVAGLGNGPRLPVVTALTCLISQFAYPSLTSLGEELVLRSNGGAIAVYGPTWMSYNAAASALGGHLLPELAAPNGGRLGDRILRGLNAYAAAGGDRGMLRLYTLLGDPALKMKR